MSHANASVRAAFDRIARFAPDHEPNRQESHLMARVPPSARRVLDVGCGTGILTRALARRVERVVAIDFAPEMVARARRALASSANVEVIEADFMALELEPASFDAIVSFATLHHLPFEDALRRMASLLAPSGVLLVLDLFDADRVIELPYNVVCYLHRLLGRRSAARAHHAHHAPHAKHGHHELQAAWADHAKDVHVMPLGAIRRRSRAVLPGAQVRRHLGWRYSLEWHPSK
jgi:ubiquinone/menaquinone biosynthesis C-methylase UbiE